MNIIGRCFLTIQQSGGGMSPADVGTRLIYPVILAGALILNACGRDDQGRARAPGDETIAGPAVAASPGPQEQVSSRKADIVARALAKNGLAEAQVVEASRSSGVLTVRVRFHRAQGARGVETIYGSAGPQDDVYVVAGDKKYFLLADTEGNRLASKELFLKLDEDTPVAATWFGKFPAPGPEVRSISLILPNVEPLDAIPLTDR